MRDALSLLDQAIAHGSGRVEEAQVREMLGTVDLDYLFALLDAFVGKRCGPNACGGRRHGRPQPVV